MTQPEEFQLASLRRHEQYQEAMREKVEADNAKARALAEFKVSERAMILSTCVCCGVLADEEELGVDAPPPPPPLHARNHNRHHS